MIVNFDDIKKIFENYDIGIPAEFIPMKKGVANKLFKIVTNQGDYTLKIAIRNSEHNRIQHEIDLLNHIKNLPSPKPIKDLHGKYLTEYKRYKCFVYPYLVGQPPEELSDDMIIQAAHALAKLHIQVENFVPTQTERIRLWDVPGYYEFKELETSIKKVTNREIREGAEYALAEIEQFIGNYSDLPHGCLHGDFKPENLLYLDGQLTGIVDFDNSYNKNLAFEVGYALAWFSLDNHTFNLNKAKVFFDEYQRTKTLSEEECLSIYPQIQFLYLIMIIVNTHWLFDEKLPLPEEFTLWNVREFIPAYQNLRDQKDEFIAMVKTR
ncbi:phosphotransferase [Patescibacteria group bacterium]|nr:phosphotransferase [Patescibacteria group bacterium]